MPISCHFRDCKALLSMCSSWSSVISSTGPLPLPLPLPFTFTFYLYLFWILVWLSLSDLVVLQMVPTLLQYVHRRRLLVMHLDLLVTRISRLATCGTMTVRWHATRCPDIGLWLIHLSRTKARESLVDICQYMYTLWGIITGLPWFLLFSLWTNRQNW